MLSMLPTLHSLKENMLYTIKILHNSNFSDNKFFKMLFIDIGIKYLQKHTGFQIGSVRVFCIFCFIKSLQERNLSKPCLIMVNTYTIKVDVFTHAGLVGTFWNFFPCRYWIKNLTWAGLHVAVLGLFCISKTAIPIVTGPCSSSLALATWCETSRPGCPWGPFIIR